MNESDKERASGACSAQGRGLGCGIDRGGAMGAMDAVTMDAVTSDIWIGEPPTALKPRTTAIDWTQFPTGSAGALQVFPRVLDDYQVAMLDDEWKVARWTKCPRIL